MHSSSAENFSQPDACKNFLIYFVFAILTALLLSLSNPVFSADIQKPGLISPERNSTLYTLRPELSWSAVESATRYQVAVYKGGELLTRIEVSAGTLSCIDVPNKCMATPDVDLSLGNLRWRVRAGTDNEYGRWSGYGHFKIQAPEAPRSIQPRGAIENSPTAYHWKSVISATAYEIAVTQKEETKLSKVISSADVGCEDGNATCVYSPDSLLSKGSYRWRVRGVSSLGNGRWSGYRSFRVKNGGAAPNQPPVATDSAASTDEGVSVTIQLVANDADGDALTFTVIDGPDTGALGAINADGTVVYTPNVDFTGTDSFVFQANDGAVDSNTATVTITVNDTNTGSPPTVDAGEGQSVKEGARVKLMASASDPDGDQLFFSWEQLSGPTIVLDATDSIGPEFTAPDITVSQSPQQIELEITADDRNHGTASDQVIVTVKAILDVPVGLSATSADGAVELNWDVVGEAGNYLVCLSTNSISDALNCSEPEETSLSASTNTLSVPGLVNGTEYFFVVIAQANDAEGALVYSVPGAQVSATPQEVGEPETAGVEVGPVSGNTASFNAIAEFDVVLTSQPESDVVIPVSSSDENEGVPQESSLTFTSENWDIPQAVFVAGRNSEVVDGVQDYQIVLAPAQSSDGDYNGLDPDDVEMKGVFLTLEQPTGNLNFISQFDSEIQLDAVYTGNGRLSYSLLESPAGMEVDAEIGIISWNPAESFKGNSYVVRAQVTDDDLLTEVVFSVDVPTTTRLQTEINGNTIKVTEPESSLSGLSVEEGNGNVNFSEISFERIPDGILPEVYEPGVRLTDYFLIPESIVGDVSIRFPLDRLPLSTDFQNIRLYGYIDTDHYEDRFWGSLGVDMDILETPVGFEFEVKLSEVSGIFFIGSEKAESTEEEVLLNKSLGKGLSQRVLPSNIDCFATLDDDDNLDYRDQLCEYTLNSDIQITVEGFGESANSTRWKNKVTIKQLVSWIIDAQEELKKLGLKFDNEFTVRIEPLGKSKLGYVHKKEGRKILHLSGSKDHSEITMQGTAVHEYFHHAQGHKETKIGDHKLLVNGNRKKRWFTEGSARWFEDIVFDEKNSYREKENKRGRRILEVGVNAMPPKLDRGIKRSYQRFSFFKLLSEKCEGFKDVYRELVSIDEIEFGLDESGIENFISKIKLPKAKCDFGSQLGGSRKSSIESAMLFYQYATLKEKKMSKLDAGKNLGGEGELGGEGDGAKGTFNFDKILHSFSSLKDNGQLEVPVKRVPEYGAISIEVKKDTWDNVKDDEEVVLDILTNSSMLIVSLLSDSEDFSGTKDSELDNKKHLHYEVTISTPEKAIAKQELGNLFVTLLNPGDSDIKIDYLGFEVRKKEIEARITPNLNGQSIFQQANGGIDLIDAGSPEPFFIGSNCEERGSPVFSSVVEDGATFYSIDTVLNFPDPIGSPLNRRNCSSFIAIKDEGTSDQKIWISASGRRVSFSGGFTADREYQIRYYSGDWDDPNDPDDTFEPGYMRIGTISNPFGGFLLDYELTNYEVSVLTTSNTYEYNQDGFIEPSP